MKNLKLVVLSLVSLSVFSSFSVPACAKDLKGFGVVDLNKVIENYTKAQETTAELKVKEDDLRKFVADSQSKIKEASTPVEQKSLEDKLGHEFDLKRTAYIKEQSEKWQRIEDTILSTVEDLAAKKKFELVLNKQSVLVGGTDVTQDVITQLNNEAKSGKTSK